jgi:transposase
LNQSVCIAIGFSQAVVRDRAQSKIAGSSGVRRKEESEESRDYKVAGIDVHKSMLAVVITNAGQEGEFSFERRKFGTLDSELRALAEWLSAQQVREAVMESTAQYWKPVWRQLEGQFRLSLAQAHSNRAPRGRQRDFQDAERLVRRHIAGELILSFVPDQEQRMWRTLTRTKNQLTRDTAPAADAEQIAEQSRQLDSAIF